jgi:hypothetical protein
MDLFTNSKVLFTNFRFYLQIFKLERIFAASHDDHSKKDKFHPFHQFKKRIDATAPTP